MRIKNMKNSSIKCALTKLHNSGKAFRISNYRFMVNTIIDRKSGTVYQIVDESGNIAFVKFWNIEPIIFTVEPNFFRKSSDRIIERESRQYLTAYDALYSIFLACKCFRED